MYPSHRRLCEQKLTEYLASPQRQSYVESTQIALTILMSQILLRFGDLGLF